MGSVLQMVSNMTHRLLTGWASMLHQYQITSLALYIGHLKA